MREKRDLTNIETLDLPMFRKNKKKLEELQDTVLVCKYLSQRYHLYNKITDMPKCNAMNIYDKIHIFRVAKINVRVLSENGIFCHKCLGAK